MKLGAMALVMVLALGVFAIAVSAKGNDLAQDIAQVKMNTAKYHDVNKAIADGFMNTQECVSLPGVGGMGIHFVNPKLMAKGPDSAHPDILLYEPENGKMELVGVEYLYPSANIPKAPMILDQMLHYDPGGDQPFAHWEMHAYIWELNPLGMFNDWNPKVKCPAVVV